jgi:GTPase
MNQELPNSRPVPLNPGQDEPSVPDNYRAGTVALVGRPNVGKSTLLNRLVGHKVSITSDKPQTTRHQIRGILTTPSTQYVFVDTPGMQSRHRSALHRSMNRAARTTLEQVDVVVFVVQGGQYGEADRAVLAQLPKNVPVVLVINKLDLFKDKSVLLPFVQKIAAAFEFAAVVPLSAKGGRQTDTLLGELANRLPVQPPLYGEDEITDRSERFLVSELIREKAFRYLGAELPYGLAVTIERFQESVTEKSGRACEIDATILVDRDSHKAMIIGAKGTRLGQIGSEARKDIQTLLDARVHLQLWVKVKSGWADNETLVRSYGYE